MVRILPPLNAIRAFEAAARHLSFTKSATELGVTPAAISHQVKKLENYLGVSLFRRTNKSVLLTDTGQLCLPAVRNAIEQLTDAMEQIRTGERSGILQVSVGPAFALKWLVPRLKSFADAHSEIDVRLAASMTMADFRSDQVDVAVRFGFGRYPGMRVDKLCDEVIVPMCSPRFLEHHGGLESPAALKRVTLLHDDSTKFDADAPDWSSWLAAAGVEGVDASRGPRFDHADHALQAALDGLGIVLSGRFLAAQDLAAGRLIAPFDIGLPWLAFYVVAPKATSGQHKIVAFRNWLLAEAKTPASKIQS